MYIRDLYPTNNKLLDVFITYIKVKSRYIIFKVQNAVFNLSQINFLLSAFGARR